MKTASLLLPFGLVLAPGRHAVLRFTPPAATLTSIRCFELLRDGTDRERRGLAQRRLCRTIAPWSQENPVMVHLFTAPVP